MWLKIGTMGHFEKTFFEFLSFISLYLIDYYLFKGKISMWKRFLKPLKTKNNLHRIQESYRAVNILLSDYEKIR